MTTRRQFFKQGVASGAVAMTSRFATAADSRHAKTSLSGKVMLPMPSVPWREATPIGGPHRELTRAEMAPFQSDPSGFANMQSSLKQARTYGPLLKSIGALIYNDFCLVQDKTGRWHTMGDEINLDIRGIPTLYHFVSRGIEGPYTRLQPVGSGFSVSQLPGRALTMTAPCVIWKDDRTALMFYAHVISGEQNGVEKIYDASIRVLESTDAKLESWAPRFDPAFPEQNVVFRENYCRDPEVIWDKERRLYLMYYVIGDGWTDPQAQCVLRVRTSRDLSTWSEPKTLMAPPAGYRAAESIFVLKKDDLYYLWLCGFDYGRMSLYISEDPLNFGDPVRNRVMEQHGHAPEIVYVNGEYWMACAGIASEFGQGWGIHDLLGTYLQPLKWVEASAEERAKIIRNSAT